MLMPRVNWKMWGYVGSEINTDRKQLILLTKFKRNLTYCMNARKIDVNLCLWTDLCMRTREKIRLTREKLKQKLSSEFEYRGYLKTNCQNIMRWKETKKPMQKSKCPNTCTDTIACYGDCARWNSTNFDTSRANSMVKSILASIMHLLWR